MLKIRIEICIVEICIVEIHTVEIHIVEIHIVEIHIVFTIVLILTYHLSEITIIHILTATELIEISHRMFQRSSRVDVQNDQVLFDKTSRMCIM